MFFQIDKHVNLYLCMIHSLYNLSLEELIFEYYLNYFVLKSIYKKKLILNSFNFY